jgi:hypothetical protein
LLYTEAFLALGIYENFPLGHFLKSRRGALNTQNSKFNISVKRSALEKIGLKRSGMKRAAGKQNLFEQKLK